MLYLKNLSSSECFEGIPPWRFTDFSRVPEKAFRDKGFRDSWINLPSTDFHVYTLFEGVQKNLRLRGGTPGEDNPPLVMHGLAIDYDTAMRLEEVLKALPLMGECLPNWFEQTLSGNGRLIWLFEQPLRLPSRKFAVALLQKFDGLIPFRKLPGIDEGCLKSPERYFTNGCRWTQIAKKKISRDALQGFVMKFAERFDWQQKEFGKAVSLRDIEDECRKRYPKFLDWPGEFVLGAQGPSFWVEGSLSPKSAIVHETGIHTFSSHATKAFYSWAELVGSEFVENSENLRLGKAVDGINFDGRNFIVKDGSGTYAFHNKDNLKLLLQVHRNLSGAAKRDGTPTEVDRAIAHILHYSVVDGAGPCAFYPQGVFQFGSRRILNTHQIEVLKPHPEPKVWGDGFPFLAQFLDTFFLPVHPQKERFLGWFRQHYAACLERKPVSGHGVFIAGPVGCGKTFLNRGVLGTALGGFAEANTYLIQSDGFNSELFDYALWCIDDGSITNSDRVHQLFSENVKRTVANREHRCNEKFRKAFQTPWQGRIVVTLNEDPESLRLIPNVDLSILEKLLLLRAGPRAVQFFSQPEMEKLLVRELPCFLRWLVDWTPPDHCFAGSDVRFGLTAYAEPSLLQAANLSSGKSVFVEILTRWLSEYFTQQAPTAEFWEGSATELRMAMISDAVYSELLRPYKPESIPRMLAVAMSKNLLKMELSDEENRRVFRIYREGIAALRPKATALQPQAENSNFQKQ